MEVIVFLLSFALAMNEPQLNWNKMANKQNTQRLGSLIIITGTLNMNFLWMRMKNILAAMFRLIIPCQPKTYSHCQSPFSK